jgi:hypothetical protein
MRVAAAAEGQTILGVSHARFTQLARTPGFPAPIAHLTCGKIWDADALAAYAKTRKQGPRHAGDAAGRRPAGKRVPVPPVTGVGTL